jgi:YgiT-type zinc finger domain-containing protein
VGWGIQKQEKAMKCVICKTGETHPGKATVTLQRGNTVVVVRGVPAEVCEDCGEYYLDSVTTRKVYADAEDTARRQVEVEIQRFAA